jgi:hypothetical protein
MSPHVLYFAAFIHVDLVYYVTDKSGVQYLIMGDCGIFPCVSDSYLWSYCSSGCCKYAL